MTELIVALVVLLPATVIQSVVMPFLALHGVKVDVVLLLVTAWSIRRGVEAGVLWALVGGIFLDLLSAQPLGVSVVALGCVAALVGGVGPAMRRINPLLPLLLTPLASVLATLAGALVLAALGWRVDWPVTVALVVLPAALLDSIAMPFVYGAAVVVEQRLDSLLLGFP